MTKLKLKANKRQIFGRKTKSLRKQGQLPANIYGKKISSVSIELDSKEFKKVYEESGETGLIELGVGKTVHPVLVHNVQVHPVSGETLHVDFLQVNLKEKVKTMVPIELIGESEAEKTGLGTVVQYIDEVEVEALPTDLPDVFEIDATVLKDVESVLYVSNIKYDKAKVSILNDPEQILVKIEAYQEEKEEVPVPAEEEAGVEVTKEPEENKNSSEEDVPDTKE